MVRNSGATAVVEGVGDHGCEYMTGGQAVILGPTGRNFGAGMTNGTAWVYDPAAELAGHINAESVVLHPVDEQGAAQLRRLIERHLEATGSRRAASLFLDWKASLRHFVQVVPKAMLELQKLVEEEAEGAAD
jgi:glutamate synthase (NADPH) large chain